MENTIERPAAVKNVDTLLLYINLDNRWRDKIPASIWARKVENTTSQSRQTAEKSIPLFEGKAVDAYYSVDDLTRRNYVVSHMHIMVRQHGGFRIRVKFVPRKNAPEILSGEEIVWVLKLMNDHLFDAMAYRNTPTEHLPFHHINLGLANPIGKGKYESRQSVQIFRGELALIHDPS